ncbi:MAG: peptide chain release factor 2 [Bacteroidales bacterium]|nr:peptide chain release factor 2 [Bacteroidales bacterium]
MFDFSEFETKLIKLRKQSEAPDLWTDNEYAQSLMRTISNLENDINIWKNLESKINDTRELAEFQDESLRPEIEVEIDDIENNLSILELKTILSGKYDKGNAILAVHAGAGGTDSQDWAMMLERMYLRWAERNGYSIDVLDRTDGEEAGIKSVTLSIKGDYAFGYLRSEKGTHRLVRLSPFDSNHRRHTSFAMIEILPEVTSNDTDIKINQEDIRIDVFKSSGAGGQNVQKNSTAVRITHIPTGIVVSCQNERSQVQNRENAMRVLKARLISIQHEKQDKQLAELRGEYKKAEWGNQIRSYVLHPYQMVKDHRTEYEEGNTQAVLDGNLSGFIESFLKSK